jgi:two-component system sensor histidine kinase/response regulator
MLEGPVPDLVYRALFTQMRMPLILTDRAFSHFLDLNETAARLLGLPSAELYNHSPAEFFPELNPGKQNFQAPFQSRLKTECETRNVILYPSELQDYLALAWVVLPSQAEIEAENERLQTISLRKSELIANLSHELKTPLTAILGWPEILLDLDLPERVHQAASSIEREGKLLLGLMEDLMDLSKVEAGQLRLDIRPENLNDVVSTACEMVREKAREKGLNLELDLPEVCLVVKMDPLRITQVLLNLLSNAIKFTPSGGQIQLAVTLESGPDSESQAPEWVKLSLKDNGVGLEAESQALIFQRFMRAPETQAVDGAGIGLSLVQKFVELHGGQVGVESQPGLGSTFWFTLPLALD